MRGREFASLNKEKPLGCGLDVGVVVQLNLVVQNGLVISKEITVCI